MTHEHEPQEKQLHWLKIFLAKIAQPIISVMESWNSELTEKMKYLSLQELQARIASGDAITAYYAAEELVKRSEIARGFNPDAQ